MKTSTILAMGIFIAFGASGCKQTATEDAPAAEAPTHGMTLQEMRESIAQERAPDPANLHAVAYGAGYEHLASSNSGYNFHRAPDSAKLEQYRLDRWCRGHNKNATAYIAAFGNEKYAEQAERVIAKCGSAWLLNAVAQ